jgi:hypothetical protein
MAQRIVGYSADKISRDADVLPATLLTQGAQLLTTRYDGRSLENAEAAERPGVIEALFCVRANLVDAVWVPDWHHMRGASTRAVVCVETWQAGGEIFVGTEHVTPDHLAALVGGELVEHTCAATALMHELSPRRTSRLGGSRDDLSMSASESSLARLAHKLHNEFRLPLQDVAEILNHAGLIPPQVPRLSTSRISTTLSDFQDELYSSTPEQASNVFGDLGRLLFAIGDDTDATRAAAAAYNAGLAEPRNMTGAVLPTWQGITAALEAARVLGCLDTVFVGETELFKNPLVREIAEVWLRESGVKLAWQTQGVEHDNGIPADMREVTAEGVRLFLKLRMHDRETITEYRRSDDFARSLAFADREAGESLRATARLMDAEAVPLRRNTSGASWSASAVRHLLEEKSGRR